jgi:hypothetical protein
MERKTLDLPDKLKEEPTTTFGYPLPKGIHEFLILREYHNTERHYTKTSRSIAGERNDQLDDDYNGD